jgi:UDP-glucose 4-epimerase
MILVTGGTGYIGLHVCVELLSAGYDLVVIDNLSNSCIDSIVQVSEIENVELLILDTNCLHSMGGGRLTFIQGDVRDRKLLRSVFKLFDIDAVIHLAGLKAVGESVETPLRYYDNNVSGSVTLLEIMTEFCCKCVVFSSSATVYGNPTIVPIPEQARLSPTNPYGQSKLIVERLLHDIVKADTSWRIAILRYFNPVGAHPSGKIGENPRGIPNNLLPFIAQVAVGKLPELTVFGNDYPTPDGTGVRDYIHVQDLAQGHLCALRKLADVRTSSAHVFNLGTGQGYSVLQMIHAFENASGCSIPYRIAPRRLGDIAICYADPSKAHRELDWRAQLGLSNMMRDTWRWAQNISQGYSCKK